MTDPILLVLKHICKKKGLKSDFQSFNNIFKIGLFKDFVSATFDNIQIPGTKKGFFFPHQISINNQQSVMFLIDKNPEIARMNPNWEEEKDQKSMLKTIIKFYYYKKSFPELITQCNILLAPHHLEIKSIADFSEGKAFMYLFQAYTNGEIRFDASDDKFIMLNEAFRKTGITQIINDKAFLPDCQDILKFQVEIMLDEFSEKECILTLPAIETPAPRAEKRVIPVTFADDTIYNNNSNINNNSSAKKIQSDESSDSYEYDSDEIALNKQKAASSTNALFSDYDFSGNNTSASDDDACESEILKLTNSYVNIINYILGDDTVVIIDDINDGIIVPSLIQKVLNDKIDDLKEADYLNIIDINSNNRIAVKHLIKYDKMIGQRSFTFSYKYECEEFIQLFFKRIVFKKEVADKMIDQVNSILQSKFNTKVTNLNQDWKNGYNFVALLDFLTNGEIKYTPPPTTQGGFVDPIDLKILILNFEQSKCPIIIDGYTLDEIDEVAIMYQIKVIFDEFDKRGIKIPTILLHKEEPKAKGEGKKTENDPFEQYKNLGSNLTIRTVNAIASQIGLHFKDIDNLIDGEYLPKFVKFVVGDLPIKEINMDPKDLKDDKVKRKNIEEVIKFLKEKHRFFKDIPILLFDPKKERRELSIAIIVKGLLDIFFIKTPKAKIIERCNIIFQYNKKITNLRKDFQYGAPFLCLIHFVMTGKLNYIFQKQKFCDINLLILSFAEANIPFILDEDSLTEIYDDFIYYQLQFIFDKIDNSPTPAKIVQYLMVANFKIRKIQLPNQEKLNILLKKKEENMRNKKKTVEFLDGDNNIILKRLIADEEHLNVQKLYGGKKESIKKYEEDKKRKEEEEKRKEEEEKRKEEEEKRKEEEEERIKKEEEVERIKNEDEERIKNENEERIKNEDEERIKKEEEVERIKKEKEETIQKEYNKYINDIFTQAIEKSKRPHNIISVGNYLSQDQFNNPTNKYPKRLFLYKNSYWVFNKTIWDEFINENSDKKIKKLNIILLFDTQFDTASTTCRKCSKSPLVKQANPGESFADMYCYFYDKKKSVKGILMIAVHVSKENNKDKKDYQKIIDQIQVSLSLSADVIISAISSSTISHQIQMINNTFSKCDLVHANPKKIFLLIDNPQNPEKISPALITQINKSLDINFFKSQIPSINKKNSDDVILKWIDINNCNSYNILLGDIFNILKERKVNSFNIIKKESEDQFKIVHNRLFDALPKASLFADDFFIALGDTNKLLSFIMKRYQKLIKNKSVGFNKILNFDVLNNMFEVIFKCFQNDEDISKKFIEARTDFIMSKTKSSKIQSELEKKSKIQLNNLQQNIELSIIPPNREDKIIIEKSHHKFLEDLYFNLVMPKNKTFVTKNFNLNLQYAYNFNIETLNKQKREDDKAIQDFFIKFEKLEEEKNRIVNKNLEEQAKRSIKYVMTERESTREISVIVDRISDFNDKVPQDF